LESETYTIGEFAQLLGLSPRTIDFYTWQGLLHPVQGKNGHGYRRYTAKDRHRISLIRQLQARKFSLQEIGRILQASERRPVASAVEAIERVNSDLERLQEVVQRSRSAATAGDPSALRVIATEALQKAMALSGLLVTLLQDQPLI
jgi:DNA-binding transcriptional MerR regulator